MPPWRAVSRPGGRKIVVRRVVVLRTQIQGELIVRHVPGPPGARLLVLVLVLVLLLLLLLLLLRGVVARGQVVVPRVIEVCVRVERAIQVLIPGRLPR